MARAGLLYRVGEIATLTGVSVRTLHHYDQIGLLSPKTYSRAGYRYYGEAEILRLQQILTLRFLGFPLKQIGAVLDRPDFDLVASVRIQQAAIRDRVTELQRIEATLGELIAGREATGRWSWDSVIAAVRAVQTGLTEGVALMENYYTPEQMKAFAELRDQTSPEEIAAVEQEWTTLLAEVRASHDLDPADPRAMALADRWDALTARTMRSFATRPELGEAIKANYERGAFVGDARAPQPEDFAFIARVKGAPTGTKGDQP